MKDANPFAISCPHMRFLVLRSDLGECLKHSCVVCHISSPPGTQDGQVCIEVSPWMKSKLSQSGLLYTLYSLRGGSPHYGRSAVKEHRVVGLIKEVKPLDPSLLGDI